MDETYFFFGEWQITPSANSLRRGDILKQLEPKAMDVLQLLCRHDGEVLSSDEIVSQCWPASEVGDNPLHKIINQLRRAFGDNATNPSYIETIRKRGYRTLAKVTFPIGTEQAVSEQSWHAGSPFPGLQAYGPEHAAVFFGRSDQVTTLLDRIAQQIQFGRGFCLVLGPSGSGKSSLVNAGIMPNLMAQQGYNGLKAVSYACFDLADASSEQLLLSLASVMLDWELADTPVFDGLSSDTLGQLLRSNPQSVVDCCQAALRENADHLSVLALFIDRLEVLLSSPLFTEVERHLFIELIELFASSGCVLVISACRNDFYPLLVEYPSLMAGKSRGAHFDLAPPSRHELLQMVRLPAIAANLNWEFDPLSATPLDELLCAEAAGNPDTLPMLQYMLQALYLQRSDDDQLKASVYHQLGGIEGAIGKNAEEAIAALNPKQQACLPKVLSLLVTLREDEKSITSRSARWAELANESEKRLVQAMVDSRLFVSHLQHGEACFSIAHEALLRCWPRVTAWIEAHHDSLSIKSRLFHLSQRWLSEDKQSAYLLADGKPLHEADALRLNPFFSLDQRELEFIAASKRRAAIRRWTGRVTIALLCSLTFISILMSVKSFNAEQEATQKRLAAENLLGFMVGDFADKLRSIGRMDLLDGISNKALEYFAGASLLETDSHLSFEAKFQHAQTLEAIGEVAYSRDNIIEATEALLAARDSLLKLLRVDDSNLELLKTLGANSFWLGQIQYDAKNWQAAEPYFQAYRAYSDTMLLKAPQDQEALMELSYALNSLGSIAMNLKQFSIARQHFERSLVLKQQAVAKNPTNISLLADVADTRSWLASAALSNGELQLSINEHQSIQAEFASMPLEIKTDAYLAEILALSYHSISLQYQYRGHYHLAWNSAVESHELIQTLLGVDAENQVWARRMFMIKLHLLGLKLDYPQSDELDLFNVEQLIEQMASAEQSFSDGIKTQRLRYGFYAFLVRYALKSNDIEASKRWLAKAKHISFQLLGSDADEAEYKLSAARVALLAASIALVENPFSDVTVACMAAKAYLSDIVEVDKDPKYVVAYVDALRCLEQLDDDKEISDLIVNERIVETMFVQPKGSE
ncbi:transcriptional regulator [Shewanella colwelliana]|uniref:nSTAND1 domain-containing NTPase n=1 Tax=Shewanella colwelliana TaxID=23 RepID=UPI001BC719E3|nr:winged helix-turn-helix domain-containing protein [Shewanella colwelliana]GIU23532.1 transcriptional regulator [Shewanella colwelliana]